VSNVDGENPELDDLEMDEPDADQPDADQPDVSDETLQFDEPGALPELEPSEDLLEPGDETVEMGAADEPIQPAEEGFAEDADGLAPVEVKTEEEEEEPEEEEEEEEEEKSPGLLARLTKTSPYVVLLGIAMVAMIIALFCLWMELNRYSYELKPPQVGAVPAVQSAPPSTTATA
jgi:hypothetical protein